MKSKHRNRRWWAVFAVLALNIVVLLWVATPTIHNGVPTWIIVDALVAQLIIACGVSGSWVTTG